MPSPFESSRLKIERANQHITEIRSVVSLLPSAYVATVETDPTGGNEVVKHDLRNRDKLISDIALMLGDAVHNLHCALDHRGWLLSDVSPLRALVGTLSFRFTHLTIDLRVRFEALR